MQRLIVASSSLCTTDYPQMGVDGHVTPLTLVLRFCFYAHVLHLWVKKAPRCLSRKTNTVVVYNDSSEILDYHKFKESGP